jgi:hypothetical protein
MTIDRIELLRASSTLSGVDYIHVSNDQLELRVFFHHETLPAAVAAAMAALTPDRITIVGEGQVDPARIAVVANVTPLPVVNGRQALHLLVETPGGFGDYRLRIDSPVIDPYYNDKTFSFKAACPSELDCAPDPHRCPQEDSVDFPVDYRARDFWSFRRSLLDFASQRYPDWQDRLEPDIGVMIVELLSALGDEFAYGQDRIAREAHFETASQRRSLRALARLVDYPIDNGSGATVWLDITANAVGALNAGTQVSDGLQQIVFEVGYGLGDTGKTFAVAPQRNAFAPYLWDENDTCLPVGATTLTLEGAHAAQFVPDANIDAKGKWVLLETRPSDPAKPERRLAVRVVDARDGIDPLTAQPFTEIEWDAPIPYELDLETLAVRGNLVPATSGETRSVQFRIGPPIGPADLDPQAIERVGAGSSLAYERDNAPDDGRVKFLFSLPDSDRAPLAWLDHAGGARPEIDVVRIGDGPWSWLPSMVGEETAAATAKVFTLDDGMYRRVFGVERLGKRTELVDYAANAGTTIRFGDGEFGLAPTDGSRYLVHYRIGNGRWMNIAPDTLVAFPGGLPAFVDAASNPLAATGGRDPEPETAIRINAPQQFRAVTHRAVQPIDFEEIVERDLAWVQQAGAQMRWTGSWPTVFVTPDPFDEVGLSAAHRTEVEHLIDRVRQAGREAKVMAPRYANIDLEIMVCVAPNAYRGEVKEAVLLALFGDDGSGGFFDPDHFSFGMPLSRAALIAAIQAVPGVRAVEAMRVRRRGWFDWRDFEEYALPVGMDEVVRVANSRQLPERGAVKLVMEGGA